MKYLYFRTVIFIESIMFKSFSKLVVITTMLFAFIGQAFAYSTMSCNMTSTSHQSQMASNHMMKADDTMAHSMMKSSLAGNAHDCGDTECNCPASACTSVTFLFTEYLSSTIDTSIDKITYIALTTPKLNRKSLYRPPIFA